MRGAGLGNSPSPATTAVNSEPVDQVSLADLAGENPA